MPPYLIEIVILKGKRLVNMVLLSQNEQLFLLTALLIRICTRSWERIKRGNGITETEKRKRNCAKRVKGGKMVKGGKAEKRVKGGKTEKRVKGGKAEKRVKGGKKGKRPKKGKY